MDAIVGFREKIVVTMSRVELISCWWDEKIDHWFCLIVRDTYFKIKIFFKAKEGTIFVSCN